LAPPPTQPQPVPEVERLSLQELQRLLTDEQAFQAFFYGLESTRALREQQNKLREQNEAVARQNTEQEKEVQRFQQEILGLQQRLDEKRRQFDAKAQQHTELMSQFSTTSLIKKLGEAAGEAEVESDEIARKFLEKEISPGDFTKLYLERRKLYHLRAAKREYLLHHS